MTYEFSQRVMEPAYAVRASSREVPSGILATWTILDLPGLAWVLAVTSPRLGLIDFAIDNRLTVELYSNLTQLTTKCLDVFHRWSR